MTQSPTLTPESKFDPLALLTESVRRIPQLKWAFGVVGVASAVVIVQALVRSPIFGLVGIAGVVVAMIVLFVFSKIVSSTTRATRPVALVFMWFVMVVAMAAIGCLFWSTFFSAPWPLRSKLFTEEVTRRAEAAGLDDVAAAVKGMSEAELLKLVQLGDSIHLPGSFDPETGVFSVFPIPPEVRELDSKGLIEWGMAPADFESLMRRLGYEARLNGTQPQQITFSAPLTDADRRSLREFHYKLNDNGISLYRLLLQTIVQQIKKV